MSYIEQPTKKVDANLAVVACRLDPILDAQNPGSALFTDVPVYGQHHSGIYFKIDQSDTFPLKLSYHDIEDCDHIDDSEYPRVNIGHKLLSELAAVEDHMFSEFIRCLAHFAESALKEGIEQGKSESRSEIRNALGIASAEFKLKSNLTEDDRERLRRGYGAGGSQVFINPDLWSRNT
jgi:hypothetical protein